MKKYFPLAILSLFSQTAEAQVKTEANQRNFDVKSPYFESFLANSTRLNNWESTTGEAKLKFRDNSAFLIRNGLLNHTYGGNLDIKFLKGYGNFTDQSKRTENEQTQQSPLGPITTITTTKEKRKSNDEGISVGHRGFLIGYENAKSTESIDGSTVIIIGDNDDLVSFSTASINSSTALSFGFPYGFAKIIQNKHTNTGDSTQKRIEFFENFLLNANYLIKSKNRDLAGISLFHGGDLNTGKSDPTGISGMIWANLWKDIDANIFYEGKDKKFNASLSTASYTRLNQKDFQRRLEDGLRLAPRIYDSNLETDRRYLEDMFFTGFARPFGYNFSIDKDDVTATVDLKYLLLHRSPHKQAIGLKYRFGIGTYDIKSKEFKLGAFFSK